ncbi:MAG: hypothetical protein KDI82_08820 [Gammaproteobacteria bacterium]|nr:hypothetical protein [Gammaproteobacteria bacterium]
MYVGQESPASSERRGHRAAIPRDVESILNQEQLNALHKVENFGWQLAFIRQPLFDTPISMIVSPDKQRYAVLELDGEINMNPDIVIRH